MAIHRSSEPGAFALPPQVPPGNAADAGSTLGAQPTPQVPGIVPAPRYATPPARILGVPGGGLKSADTSRGGPDWLLASTGGDAQAAAARAAYGKGGEEQTAALLNTLAIEAEATVMHDLMIPSKRYTANIDHLVVSGSSVYLFDTKVWKPGTYWTSRDRCYRRAPATRGGRARTERFEPGEKHTMGVALSAMAAFFGDRGVPAAIYTPTLVIWPSSDRAPLRLRRWGRRLRIPEADAVNVRDLSQYLRRTIPSPRAAEPSIVAALMDLLVTRPA